MSKGIKIEHPTPILSIVDMVMTGKKKTPLSIVDMVMMEKKTLLLHFLFFSYDLLKENVNINKNSYNQWWHERAYVWGVSPTPVRGSAPYLPSSQNKPLGGCGLNSSLILSQ